jgi:hypothetical protein
MLLPLVVMEAVGTGGGISRADHIVQEERKGQHFL